MKKSLIEEDTELEQQIHSEQYELQNIIRDVNNGIVALNEEAGLWLHGWTRRYLEPGEPVGAATSSPNFWIMMVFTFIVCCQH